MSTITEARPLSSGYFGAGLWALAVVAMTAIHHIYGAIAFETPWRLHIVFIALPIGLAIVVALLVAARGRGTGRGRGGLWIAAALIFGFCVFAIGIYEGGYNHLVANIVYLAFGAEAFADFYDTSIHEVPVDLIFEVTGIAQFVVALAAAWATLELLRKAR